MLYLEKRGGKTISKFSKFTNKVKNLTTSNFLEIEILLYKSRSLNMKQKELHQYLSKEKSFYSKATLIFSDSQIVTSVTK